MNDRLLAMVDRELTLEESREYLGQPISPREREDVLELVRWFTTRYPTPLERLTYVRRATTRWRRSAGADRRP